MFKKYVIPLLFLAFFFSLPSRTNAATYTYSISDSNFEPLTSADFWIVKSHCDNFLLQNPTYTSYSIIYDSSSTLYNIYLSNAIEGNVGLVNSSTGRRFQLPFVFNSGSTLFFKESYNPITHNFTSGTVGNPPSYIAQKWVNTQTPWPLDATLLYANYDWTYTYANTLVFNYLNTSYSWTTNDTYPTLYDLYIRVNPDFGPPVAPVEDPYPTLTSFYTLVIEKLTYITEYFSSSYIYLSIIVVLLLMFFIFLLKRRF